MPSWTESELLAEIAETKLEMVKRRGINSYQVSDGMGNQSVSNRSLKDLMNHLNNLESLLEDVRGNGLISVDFPRDIGGIR